MFIHLSIHLIISYLSLPLSLSLSIYLSIYRTLSLPPRLLPCLPTVHPSGGNYVPKAHEVMDGHEDKHRQRPLAALICMSSWACPKRARRHKDLLSWS